MPYSLSMPELLEQLTGRDNNAAWHAGQTLLTLKCEPETALFLRQQHPEILPGFYMDKRSRNSAPVVEILPVTEENTVNHKHRIFCLAYL